MSFPLYMIHFTLAALSSVAFSILFSVPKKELLYCGVIGGIGWVFLQVIQRQLNASGLVAMFFATMIVALLSRIFAINRKIPITIYLIAGCIPLVPGYGVFFTMRDLVNSAYVEAAIQGIETIKVGGIMVVSMMIVFSLPSRVFDLKISQKNTSAYK